MIPVAQYHPLFYNIILILTLISFFKMYSKLTDYNVSEVKVFNDSTALILAILLILFMGLRPINTSYFGDTVNYAHSFRLMERGQLTSDAISKDWLFYTMMLKSSHIMNVGTFFLIIESIYIGSALLAIYRLFPNNVWLAFLTFVGAFSFFSYGVNGIRNGMAASIFLLALSYAHKKWVLIALVVLAGSFHSSLWLPAIALTIGYFYNNSKLFMTFWVFAIPMSFFFGGFFANFFAGLGFDERLSKFISDSSIKEQFSNTGFRWDFLLYSSIPVAVGYYVIFIRKVTSGFYSLLLNTYIISNAVWILIIKSGFSNRFAYLSWFLYPVVLLYPFLNFNLWKKQYNIVAIVVLMHFAFTYIMRLLGKI